MEYVKVKDHSNLVRDPKSNSIINTNKSAYNQYVARRNAKNEEVNKAQTMEEDLANLKSEISEIKSLLKELVSNVN